MIIRNVREQDRRDKCGDERKYPVTGYNNNALTLWTEKEGKKERKKESKMVRAVVSGRAPVFREEGN